MRYLQLQGVWIYSLRKMSEVSITSGCLDLQPLGDEVLLGLGICNCGLEMVSVVSSTATSISTTWERWVLGGGALGVFVLVTPFALLAVGGSCGLF